MTTYGTVSQPTTRAARQSLLARHPLAAFFSIAIIGSWLAVLPVLLSRNGFGLLPIEVPIEPLKTIASFTGPFLAAFLVTAAAEGQPGVRSLLKRMVQWRVGLGWYLLAFFGYILLDLLVGMILLGTAPLTALVQKWPLIFTVYFPALLTVRLISPIGEETGWTGFAVPRLQKKFGPLLGAMILGLVWAFWHLPGFFMTGSDMGGFSLFGFGFFAIFAICTRIIWNWMVNRTAGSVLIAILLHAATNTASLNLRPQLFPPAPPEAGLIVTGLYLILVIGLIIATRGRLAYGRKE